MFYSERRERSAISQAIAAWWPVVNRNFDDDANARPFLLLHVLGIPSRLSMSLLSVIFRSFLSSIQLLVPLNGGLGPPSRLENVKVDRRSVPR